MPRSNSTSGLLLLLLTAPLAAFTPCKISVVDSESGWPVPLVELSTTHGVRMVSDNAGVVAFDLPELMGRETWLRVEGHGYSVRPDGFGFRGVRVTPTEGGAITIRVSRRLPAKRLGRITGAGLFGESQQLGEQTDWEEQLILGCDSVQNTIHQGRLYWGWGDTTLARYPLGRFHMTGAVTDPRPLDALRPPIKLRYDYVVDANGEPRDVAKLPGPGPTWLGGYASLEDSAGRPHLVAAYSKIKPPLSEYELGLCEWDQASESFKRKTVLWNADSKQEKPPVPLGHTSRWTDDQGAEWILYGDPFPTLKHRATYEAWSDTAQWVSLTPQASVPTVGDAGKPVKPHRGAIAWNNYRQKWVVVFTQHGGEQSFLGELWYAEADRPTGPWKNAVQVVTHNKYTFYNPQVHPEFTAEDSPTLLFEATFTHTFSATPDPVPRHDYNQVLYRLDLDEAPFSEPPK